MRGVFHPRHTLPPRVREFGYVPDLNQLRPGDLVLFSAVKPRRRSRAIVRSQRDAGHHEADARWHHAAVYVGDSEICEAVVWRGVHLASLYDSVETHLLRFRRDPRLTDHDSWRVAVNALRFLRRRYGLAALFRIWQQTRLGFWRPDIRHKKLRARICSELYADAYTLTTGRMLMRGTLNILTPAELSVTAALADIQVDWLQIA